MKTISRTIVTTVIGLGLVTGEAAQGSRRNQKLRGQESDMSSKWTTSAIVASVTATIGVGLVLAVASPASAEPVTVSQDPSTVKMICDKYGGTYGPPGPESGGAVCLYPDGGFTNCDLNNNCTFYPAGSRPNVVPPSVRPGSNGAVG